MWSLSAGSRMLTERSIRTYCTSTSIMVCFSFSTRSSTRMCLRARYGTCDWEGAAESNRWCSLFYKSVPTTPKKMVWNSSLHSPLLLSYRAHPIPLPKDD